MPYKIIKLLFITLYKSTICFQVMAAKKDLPWCEVKQLGDLQKKLGVTLDDMTQLVNELLHAEPYSKKEVCDILNVEVDDLEETSLNQQTRQSELVTHSVW